MTEQKTKKSKGIAKKFKKNILAPCIKSPREKQNVPNKQDIDNIDNGSLYFDSSKYLKRKNFDLDTISSTLSRPTNRTEITVDSEVTDYLRRKPQNEGKEKEEITEIVDIESSDDDDDIPLSQLTKLKQTPSQQKVEINTIKNEENLAEIKETENVELQNVPMPVPVDSFDENLVSIPAKMEPTKSGMDSLVDTNVVKQSIPMPQPTDSLMEETELTTSANNTSYIIEEIVTEEIVNGKKRITTQTITRRANNQNQVTPVNQTNAPTVNKPSSIKMPVAVGSEMEEVKIPAKMTPTKTETTKTTEGIVEMPMNLPKPSSSKTTSNNGIPNLVESELEGMPISEIVNENNMHPNAMNMPSVPKLPNLTSEVPQENITENVVSSPKLMAEESPLTTTELALDQHQSSQPVVEPGFNINVPPPPPPVEAGFNFNNIPSPAQSVEAGFNIFVPNQDNGSIPVPPPPQLPSQPTEPGFNFTVTNEDNIAIPLPATNENNLNNIQGIPNLLATDSANRKQAKQQGYLDIPQPLPPSAIEDNQVVEDDRSDVSYGSKKNVVSSPKVLTADEQIQFTEQLATEQKIEHEEALKNEKPLGTFTMPKTPSTYFKNNNLSDNEGASNEAVNVPSPAALPTVFDTPAAETAVETEKVNVNAVQEEDESSDSDDENLFNIKQKY